MPLLLIDAALEAGWLARMDKIVANFLDKARELFYTEQL